MKWINREYMDKDLEKQLLKEFLNGPVMARGIQPKYGAMIERKKYNLEVFVDDYEADNGEQRYFFEDVLSITEMCKMFVVTLYDGTVTGINQVNILRFNKFKAE